MKIWTAFVASVDMPFDPQTHCTEADAPLSVTVSEVEGQPAAIEIGREQRGWSVLAPSQPRSVLVSWSPTGEPADAVLIARGRIVELPSDLFGSRQTVRAVCSPVAVNDKLLAFATENLADAPWTDMLFADFEPEDPESYLLGRSETYRVDPATHAISIVDDLEGEATYDLSPHVLYEGAAIADAPGVYDPPAKVLKAELTIDWEQAAVGSVNVGPHIGSVGKVSSLDPAWSSNLGQFLSSDSAEGWKMGAVEVTKRTRFVEGPSTSIYETYSAARKLEQIVRKINFDFQGTEVQTMNAWIMEGPEEIPGSGVGAGGNGDQTGNSVGIGVRVGFTRAAPVFVQHDYVIERLDLTYEYVQPRSETLFAEMQVPVQASVVLDDEDPEPLYLTLKSPFDDPGIPEWKEDEFYAIGDLVYFNGAAWKCNGDHVSAFFDQARPQPIVRSRLDGFVRFVETIETFWERYTPIGLPDQETMTSFLKTTRGQTAITHVYCRLRKNARRRMRARHITFSCRWQDAVHVTMRDAAQLTVPWGDGTDKVVTGKVVARELLWSGEGQPLVRLEIAIPFGTGIVHEPDAVERYVEAGYVQAGYEEATAQELDFYHIEEDVPVDVPVDVSRLRSGSYALRTSDVGNQAPYQLGRVGAVMDAGGAPGDVSVVHPTWIKLGLRSIVAQNPIVREVGSFAALSAGPKGVDLG